MQYLIVMSISYLLGASNMAYYISKYRNVDIKNNGSKNLGASNATILLGWRFGILVAVHDIGKALLAVWISQKLFPDLTYVQAIAGVAAVIGHIFPFYLKFHGGKGFAPYIGMAFAIHWKLALVVLGIAMIMVFLTDYMVIGTTATITGIPLGMFLLSDSWILMLILMTASFVVIYKHMDNYKRLSMGTEFRVRSSSNGSHRIRS